MKRKTRDCLPSAQTARILVILSITMLLASAVAQNGQGTTSSPLSSSATSIQTHGAPGDRVRIGPGDLLSMSVFDVPELSQEIRVSDRGDAVLTLIGPLHLAGMAPAEAQTLIEKRLRDGNYVLDPHASIVIREYETQGVSVLGEVKKPGVYPVLGSRTLLDVISEAGGTTDMAARQATVKRRAGGVPLEASLSNQPGELLASNLELQPGDTVVVPRAGIVYVLGEVGRPGGFVMQNNSKMTLLQAVSLAAGATHTAAQSKTRIIHKTDSGSQDITVDLKRILEGKQADVTLKAEDIVYVPANRVKMLLQNTPISSLAQSAASAAIYVGMVP